MIPPRAENTVEGGYQAGKEHPGANSAVFVRQEEQTENDQACRNQLLLFVLFAGLLDGGNGDDCGAAAICRLGDWIGAIRTGRCLV